MKAQICIYIKKLTCIGGIETFLYNLCDLLKDDYEIIVSTTSGIAYNQLERLRKIVNVTMPDTPIECDTVLALRLADNIPDYIKYKKKLQMIHGRKIVNHLNVPNADLIIPVSKSVVKSFKDSTINELEGKDYKVILNPVKVEKPTKVLKLISATRLTPEKGGQRMLELARLLKVSGIPFIWYVFSNRELHKPKKEEFNGIVEMPSTLNISSWIKECDYLVQLSDTESFGYSIVESLMLGVPVITTPLDVLSEIGVKDGVNGWVVPFDMKNIDVDKIYNSNLKFEYKYDNKSIANEWKEVLGEPKPFVKYIFKEVKMKIKALRNNVTLTAENIKTKKGEIYEVSSDRAALIVAAGYAEYVKEEKKEDAKKKSKLKLLNLKKKK